MNIRQCFVTCKNLVHYVPSKVCSDGKSWLFCEIRFLLSSKALHDKIKHHSYLYDSNIQRLSLVKQDQKHGDIYISVQR